MEVFLGLEAVIAATTIVWALTGSALRNMCGCRRLHGAQRYEGLIAFQLCLKTCWDGDAQILHVGGEMHKQGSGHAVVELPGASAC